MINLLHFYPRGVRAIRLGLALAGWAGLPAGAVTVTLNAPAGPLEPGRTIVFRAQVEGAGDRPLCHWAVQEPGAPAGAAEGALLAEGPDGSLEFTAPAAGGTRTFLVRATSRADPRAFDQMEIQVRPAAAPATPAWAYPDPVRDLPKDLEDLCWAYADREALQLRTGLAEGPPFRSGPVPAPWTIVPTLRSGLNCNGHFGNPILGYGCPAVLSWAWAPAGARQLLTCRVAHRGDGEEAVIREVPSQAAATALTLIEAVQSVELETLIAQGKGWRSQLSSACPAVRGLLPLAGNPVAGAGYQDGRGPGTRFRAPAGVTALEERNALLVDPDGPWARWRCAVVDPQSHTLRMVGSEGSVQTLCGKDREPGCEDGGPDVARFNAPTFVTARPLETCFQEYEFLVADTGNHSIRKVTEDGQVSTLAGSGRAGYRDSPTDPGAAEFNRPMGLVVGWEGEIYVADAGNAVIRRIRVNRVDTLAGRPNTRGTADGRGSEATFTELRGLARGSASRTLYAADGHAIRKIHLDQAGTARVSTILGVVDRPGFRATVSRPEPLREPCLDTPWGLCSSRNVLWIADQGNHAIRVWVDDAAGPCLMTLAGDPGRPGLHFGLLRDSVNLLPAEGYGTLASPTGIAMTTGMAGTLYVASGPCLVQLQGVLAKDGPVSAALLDHPPRLTAPPTVQAAEPVPVGLILPALTVAAGAQDYRYQVDFLEADRTLGLHREGAGSFGAPPPPISGELCLQGKGTIRLTLVTAEGVSFQTEQEITVE